MTRKEIVQRYYQKHKERIREEQRLWRLENPEARKFATKKYREKVKPLQEQKRRENYEWYIWNSLRTRSKRDGW